jgi:hypothetical protein
MRYISRMFTLPQMPSIKFPTIDLTNFDVTKFDLSKFDLSKLDLSKFDLSKFDVTKLNLPKVDLPKVDLPKVDTAKVLSVVRDAGYIVVGLGATLVERAQTHSETFAAAVNDGVEQLRGLISKAA